MAAPQQPRAITKVTALGLKSDLKMHRAHGGSLRVRIEARHEWMESEAYGKVIFNASTQVAMGLGAVHERQKTKPLRAHQQDVAHPGGMSRATIVFDRKPEANQPARRLHGVANINRIEGAMVPAKKN